MNSNTQKAKELLQSENFTLTAVNGSKIFTSHKRGVKPLLEFIDNNINLKDYSAADKVIGKAAAFLYVLLNVSEIYANVISEPALNVLTENHIKTEYGALVKVIRNRDNTGFCPMETAVKDIENAEDAIMYIRSTLTILNKNN